MNLRSSPVRRSHSLAVVRALPGRKPLRDLPAARRVAGAWGWHFGHPPVDPGGLGAEARVPEVGDRIGTPGDDTHEHRRTAVGDGDRIPADVWIGEERADCGCQCAGHRYTPSMKQESHSERPTRIRAVQALSQAFRRSHPATSLDGQGYAADFRDTLLPQVLAEDFEADLSAGDGNELATKFRAAHSSSGLAVNCFAPFRGRIADLALPMGAGFDDLRFERKCPTGVRGGRAPNLDVVLSGPGGVVGIESKLTEYLSPHRAVFSPAYAEQIRDARRNQGYFREMLRLRDHPVHYTSLDAAQCIKHAFGLAHTFPDRPGTLLYLFWEPANPDAAPAFAAHRDEIADFSARVAGSSPAFAAMSYPELWQFWQEAEPADWLVRHLGDLRARYGVTL
jgi:hypothetical protein